MITSCYKEKFWSHLIKFWAFPVWALSCHLGYSSDILRHGSHCGKWFVAQDFHFDTRVLVSGLWLLVSESNAELFLSLWPFFSQFLVMSNRLEHFAIEFRTLILQTLALFQPIFGNVQQVWAPCNWIPDEFEENVACKKKEKSNRKISFYLF